MQHAFFGKTMKNVNSVRKRIQIKFVEKDGEKNC